MTATSYRGLLYRALNPVWVRAPLSGRGAARYGGRFNPKGLDALYTSLSPETAIREANQVGHLQPTLLVTYEAAIGRVFDSRDATAMAAHGMTPEILADPDWRTRMNAGEPVPTQQFAMALIEHGHAGLLVRSFAAGATATQLNLVLWRWNTGDDDRLTVIDDEDRLPRMGRGR